jgi:hypothetical protein
MITVKAYLYPNTAEVQVFDPTIFTTRNRQVYSRPIKVYQGVDNPIQVIVMNQDQKPVDLTGYLVEAQIQDPTNQITINSYAVTWTDITKGLGNFIIDKATVDNIENRFYKLTFKTILQSNNTEAPVYIDDNYGVPLDLEILPAYWSNMAPAPDLEESVIDGGSI